MNRELLNKTIDDMVLCLGNDGRSVWTHGQMVADAAYDLHMLSYDIVRDRRYELPSWFKKHGRQLFGLIPNWQDFQTYCRFHDCGKPYCRLEDQAGKVHFSDHASQSFFRWVKIAGPGYIANCTLHDMDIHSINTEEQVKAFAALPEAPSLLIAGLAEIHANAEMFGGLDSPGFKIKFAQIERRGKQICKILFGEK